MTALGTATFTLFRSLRCSQCHHWLCDYVAIVGGGAKARCRHCKIEYTVRIYPGQNGTAVESIAGIAYQPRQHGV